MGTKNAIINIKNKYRSEGFYAAIKYSEFLILINFYKKAWHKFINPSLYELYQIAYNINFLSLSRKFNIDQYNSEFQKVFERFNQIRKSTKLNYPQDFGIDESEAKFLYGVVRKIKPEIFVETGVANGDSSFFILSAIKKNKIGKLISIDVNNNVGNRVPKDLRKAWELKILQRNFSNNFKSILSSLPKVDIFLHDSDHSYEWQMLEYTTALNKLNKKGLLLSDDIDGSYALIDLIRANPNKYKVFTLVTNRKVFGIIRK